PVSEAPGAPQPDSVVTRNSLPWFARMLAAGLAFLALLFVYRSTPQPFQLMSVSYLGDCLILLALVFLAIAATGQIRFYRWR
ncbi:MAG: hypothetical protein AAFN70_15780, partial [Planctomycetota bacterium]